MRGYIALVLLLGGCAGRDATSTSSTSQQQAAQKPAICAYPSGIESDASATDACVAGPPGQSCEVSNGATIDADGSVENGTKSCKSLCPASHYELTCRSSDLQGAIASPADGLGCKVIPLPTPSNELFYCCPCTQ